ncbi:MFS transporter [Streptomyces qinzhouensis]|uniref:MFS transporter n=1 Tax=Streptomyces qinzhouensis TaxID=2599401 RepID=A0A5B8JEE4_9ACTN|nr:MFS transporter [Streptomyces qinzhouensis]QDY80125.1 MFS transporter [Streptomyces qinzhouensis]
MTSEPAVKESGTASGDGLFSRRYGAATATFAVVMFLEGFAALAVLPTLPLAARQLDGVSLYPLVAGCFVAASLIGAVLGGSWADRSGPHRPLAAGVGLAVVTLLISGTSTTIWQLAAGRFLEGMAAGMIAVAVNTAIAHSFPDHLRPRALALMSTCWIVPSLIGPPLAGLVVAWSSWRTVFLGLAVLNVLPALAIVVMLVRRARAAAPPEGKTPEKGPRPPLLIAATVALGAALGQYGVSDWDVLHLVCAGIGVTLLVVFAPRLLPPGTWRAAPGLPATALLRGLASGAYFTLEAFVPLMLDSERRVSPVQTGIAFTGAAILWAAGSWLQGRWLTHWPRHRTVTVGALIMAGAMVVAVAGAFPATPPVTSAVSLVIAAFGMGMLTPTVTLLSLSHSPPGRQGYASSALQTTQNLGQIAVMGLAAALFNAGLNSPADPLVAFGSTFALLLVFPLLAAFLAGRARES